MISLLLTSAFISAAPPITSLPQALGQLGAANGEAAQVDVLKAVEAACRGKFRRDLVDKSELEEKLAALLGSGSVAVKKSVLDAGRCFSPAKYVRFLKTAFEDADPRVAAYGGEVAARFADAALADVVVDAFVRGTNACLEAGLDASKKEKCVWLTYAPSAVISTAAEKTRKAAADQAVKMFTAPYAKVREVAVETVAASGLAAFAPELAKLITKETKKELPDPNSPELVGRFKERQKALERRK